MIGKVRCEEGGGSAFREHGKFKSYCRECGGSAFCEHGKRKETCKDCGGSAFCEHGKFKSTCKDCGGSAFCEHGKFYSARGLQKPQKNLIKRAFAAALFPDSLQSIFVGTAEIFAGLFRLRQRVPRLPSSLVISCLSPLVSRLSSLERLARQFDCLNCTLALSKAFEWFSRHVFNFQRKRRKRQMVGLGIGFSKVLKRSLVSRISKYYYGNPIKIKKITEACI